MGLGLSSWRTEAPRPLKHMDSDPGFPNPEASVRVTSTILCSEHSDGKCYQGHNKEDDIIYFYCCHYVPRCFLSSCFTQGPRCQNKRGSTRFQTSKRWENPRLGTWTPEVFLCYCTAAPQGFRCHRLVRCLVWARTSLPAVLQTGLRFFLIRTFFPDGFRV